MSKKTNKTDISTLAPLLTLVVFSVCILLVLLFGAKLYKNALDRDSTNFDKRTAQQYITTRIRQSDADGMVFVGTFEDGVPSSQGDTFFFVERYSGITYYTRIYCHDGYLYELFAAAEDVFDRQDGEKILPLDGISYSLEGETLKVHILHPDGTEDTLVVALRSADGGGYEE